MKKRFIISIFVVAGGTFSVVGVCFAAIFNYYVVMNGSTNVHPPKFYIGSATEETLLINEKSPDCASFGINSIHRTFQTENFEQVSFNYLPKASFSIRAKVATTTPQDLILNFGYFDSQNASHLLCTDTVTVGSSMGNYSTDFSECAFIPTGVEKFYYEFSKGCPDCEYTISKCASGFYTNVALTK
ncbi:MAG: hypothetical protein K9M15_01550 [Candidatus Marinimicrobia bacterium]|nr:hypothetical protein [Candidatus Neomarinimicrobiota bacterium]